MNGVIESDKVPKGELTALSGRDERKLRVKTSFRIRRREAQEDDSQKSLLDFLHDIEKVQEAIVIQKEKEGVPLPAGVLAGLVSSKEDVEPEPVMDEPAVEKEIIRDPLPPELFVGLEPGELDGKPETYITDEVIGDAHGAHHQENDSLQPELLVGSASPAVMLSEEVIEVPSSFKPTVAPKRKARQQKKTQQAEVSEPGLDAFFEGRYGLDGSNIPAMRRKHSFVAMQPPYVDSDLGMRLGLVYEADEDIPTGEIYSVIKEGVKEIKQKAASEENYVNIKDKYAAEGWEALKHAAKKLDAGKLRALEKLDPAKYIKKAGDGRQAVSGRYLKLFKEALKAEVANYSGSGVSKEVIKQLQSLDEVELIHGKPAVAHLDARKNKAVVYLSQTQFSPEERKGLKKEGLSDEGIKNLELIYSAYAVRKAIYRIIHRASSNAHVRNSMVQMQADTYLDDLSEGLCMFYAIEGLLSSGALKGLTPKDKKNIWKMAFASRTISEPIDADSFEQFLLVEGWLKPKAAGKNKAQKAGKLESELSKLPKHLQKMRKGRIYLSSDDLSPYTGKAEIEASRESFNRLASALTNKEKALSYPEALAVKLLVTVATANETDELSPVKSEAYMLLDDLIKAFDTNKKGKIVDGFVYNTYKKILPRVCEG